MGKDAHVAAAENRDTRGKRGLETRALSGNRLRLWLLALLPAGVLFVGIYRGESRAECNATLGHQREYFGCPPVTVFDRVHAGHDRVPHPLGALSVGRDGCAARMSRTDTCRQRLQGECGTRSGNRTPSIVCVELDPVGPLADLAADDTSDRFDAVGFLG